MLLDVLFVQFLAETRLLKFILTLNCCLFLSEPALNFTPVFSEDTTDYYATVPHDVLLVKIWGFAKSCNCEARLDDKYGLSR